MPNLLSLNPLFSSSLQFFWISSQKCQDNFSLALTQTETTAAAATGNAEEEGGRGWRQEEGVSFNTTTEPHNFASSPTCTDFEEETRGVSLGSGTLNMGMSAKGCFLPTPKDVKFIYYSNICSSLQCVVLVYCILLGMCSSTNICIQNQNSELQPFGFGIWNSSDECHYNQYEYYKKNTKAKMVL